MGAVKELLLENASLKKQVADLKKQLLEEKKLNAMLLKADTSLPY